MARRSKRKTGRKKARVPTRRAELPSRRAFLAGGVACAAGGALLARRVLARSAVVEFEGLPIRPPTADLDDEAFQTKCIRCGLCGTVCENGCIRFFGLDEGDHGPLTPYLDVRHRACTLCMRCTNICPTGALSPVADDLEVIVETVDMGVARVDPDRCLSYLGRVCGYCHDACPLPGSAIRLTPPALPVVLDGCVGCGQCVEQCPQSPTAIFLERRRS